MILISYDIKDDKLRNRFCKYIKKFGYRLQYSVFEITNSRRMLQIIMCDIANEFEKQFSQEDSVILIETGESCNITRWGYAKNEESDIIVVS